MLFHGAWRITLGLVLRLEVEFQNLGKRVRQLPPEASGGRGRGIQSASWVKCRAQCLACNPYTPSLLAVSWWHSLFTGWVLAHNRSSVNVCWVDRFESPTGLTQLPRKSLDFRASREKVLFDPLFTIFPVLTHNYIRLPTWIRGRSLSREPAVSGQG